jgi:hypothetical protein
VELIKTSRKQFEVDKIQINKVIDTKRIKITQLLLKTFNQLMEPKESHLMEMPHQWASTMFSRELDLEE